ncbi:tetratricopeptide repeat protein [Pigmentibacter sp. JX0631]|uniref:tetratricopeptide repeat protein n=1 Tax=Pigmentibacter sp. JX0631 TaxID=2976982 RepID=UPI0024691674|nr:tetratricopeptide repeat protein [Pigmentibacter sp. JX0631]WGL59070.1 tetratricopeptide repeat protein [Pigmentibacter sp. JX0631]
MLQGSKPIFLFFLLNFSAFTFISCQTNKENNSASIPNPPRSKIQTGNPPALEVNPPSYLQARILRISYNFQTNRLSQADSDEAFMLGKMLEERKNYLDAEKMYSISFSFNSNLNCGLSLMGVLLNLKKYQEALLVGDKLSVLFPNKPEIDLAVASIYQLNGNYPILVKKLEKAYKKYPNNEAIVINYVANVKQHRKNILENFLLKNPKSTNIMMALAQKYYNEKNYTNSLKFARRAYKIDYDNIEIITLIARIEQNLRNYGEAEKFFKIAFDKETENNLAAQNYINILLFQKKIQIALSILLKLEASSDEHVPFPPEFSFQIAKILIVNKDFTGARKRLQELLGLNYNNSTIHYYLAICSEGLRLFSEAIANLDKIPIENELYRDALKAKIIIYINAKDTDSAKKSIEKFGISESNLVQDTIFKVNMYAYFSKYKEAIDLLNNAIKKVPTAKELYLKKAEYLKFSESDSASIAFAEQLSTKWPNYAEVLNFLGYSLAEKNVKIEYARKILHKAVSLEPQNGFYLDSLGWLYFQKNDLKNSLKYIEEALKYEPDEPVINYHHALVFLKSQQYEQALKKLEMTNKILSDMLPYQVESDPELTKIAGKLGEKLQEVKRILETQKRNISRNL